MCLFVILYVWEYKGSLCQFNTVTYVLWDHYSYTHCVHSNYKQLRPLRRAKHADALRSDNTYKYTFRTLLYRCYIIISLFMDLQKFSQLIQMGKEKLWFQAFIYCMLLKVISLKKTKKKWKEFKRHGLFRCFTLSFHSGESLSKEDWGLKHARLISKYTIL